MEKYKRMNRIWRAFDDARSWPDRAEVEGDLTLWRDLHEIEEDPEEEAYLRQLIEATLDGLAERED